jgi:hypothetical protein
MQFRCRREVLVVLLGLSVLAFAFTTYIVGATPESWRLIYLNAPLFLLCFSCIFGSLVAYRFLPRKWGICFLGGTILGVAPLVLALVNLLVLVAFGEKSALIIFIFDRYAEWLYEPGAIILSIMGLQFDIYSSHISDSWLLISWMVYTLLAVVIWTMVLVLALKIFNSLRRKFLHYRRS